MQGDIVNNSRPATSTRSDAPRTRPSRNAVFRATYGVGTVRHERGTTELVRQVAWECHRECLLEVVSLAKWTVLRRREGDDLVCGEHCKSRC